MLFLIALQEMKKIPLTENGASGIGIVTLILFVAAAVALFIANGMKTNSFEYLEKEPIELAYGVEGMVKERQNKLRDKHIRDCVVGVCLCVLSALPVLIFSFLEKADGEVLFGVCLTLLFVAAGVNILIRTGITWGSTEILLQQDDYTVEKKMMEKKLNPIATIYWCVMVAAYLGWSFYTFEWHRTWIIWPVAAVLFGIFEGILKLASKK